MKKRALTLLLALVMCLSLCTPVMAEEVTPERTIVYTTTAEERDAIFEAEVEKALAALSNGSAREVRYQYKSENLTDKYKIKQLAVLRVTKSKMDTAFLQEEVSISVM